MAILGKRVERDINQAHWSGPEAKARADERSRETRWSAKSASRVEHPAYGSVVVPHHSNFSAILNAAEFWGCDWLEILDAKVWAVGPGEKPVPPPIHY